MIDYKVERIKCSIAKEYIRRYHYTKGCNNAPSPCYGLFDNDNLIGVLMFATPCSENVRASLFGKQYKSGVIELHRLHIMDVTPKNTESYFIAKCLKQLLEDRPDTMGVISFSDTTVGHEGTIYKATNAIRAGRTGKAWFFIDREGRLRHPRQNGVNITDEMASAYGWSKVRRESKNRYIYILGKDKREQKRNKMLYEQHIISKERNRQPQAEEGQRQLLSER